MSTTRSQPRPPKFELVYDITGKTPKVRHSDKRCWSTMKFRKATPEEIASLPVCQHCAKRAERDVAKAKAEKPKRQPITRKQPTAKAKATAPVESGVAAEAR
jgi:hypothetical protein